MLFRRLSQQTAILRWYSTEGTVKIVQVPALGDSITECTVGTWTKAAGDAVAVDEVVVELETDKIEQSVFSQDAGRIEQLFAETGDTLEVGMDLYSISVGAEGKASTSAPESASSSPPQTPTPTPTPPSTPPPSIVPAVNLDDYPFAAKARPHMPRISFPRRQPGGVLISDQLQSSERSSASLSGVCTVELLDHFEELPLNLQRRSLLTEEEMEMINLGGAKP